MSRQMRVLIVSMYWPPAGGAGVQRPLKLSGHLAELGFEVHVLAPDDSKWLHRDPTLRTPPGVIRAPGHQPWAEVAPTGGGAARAAWARPVPGARLAGGPATARSRRRSSLEPDLGPGCAPHREEPQNRRRPDDVTSRLGALRRRRGRADDGGALGRRSPRLARDSRAPPPRCARGAGARPVGGPPS